MDDRLQQAKDFVQSEDIANAKTILMELVHERYPSADSWYLMMYCMDTTRQKIWCLEEALRIKADHSEALVMLGMLAPGHQMYTGARYRKEKQNDELSEEDEPFNWVVAGATLGTVLILTAVVILLGTFVF
jgi:hypothetical protein